MTGERNSWWVLVFVGISKQEAEQEVPVHRELQALTHVVELKKACDSGPEIMGWTKFMGWQRGWTKILISRGRHHSR